VISAVFDTNILASGTVSAAGPPGQVLDAWRAGHCELIVSEPILTELTRTLTSKPYFQARLTPEQIQRFEMLVRRRATMTPIIVAVHGVATHPEDDVILATAVSGKAHYLVTGDRKLQELGSYQGVSIVSPAAFLALLLAQQ
jgi:putative PIN family toxin of toxin-antitoxin system